MLLEEVVVVEETDSDRPIPGGCRCWLHRDNRRCGVGDEKDVEGGGQWSVAGTTSSWAGSLALAEASCSRAVILPAGLLGFFPWLLRGAGRVVFVSRLTGLSVNFPEDFEAACQYKGYTRI